MDDVRRQVGQQIIGRLDTAIRAGNINEIRMAFEDIRTTRDQVLKNHLMNDTVSHLANLNSPSLTAEVKNELNQQVTGIIAYLTTQEQPFFSLSEGGAIQGGFAVLAIIVVVLIAYYLLHESKHEL